MRRWVLALNGFAFLRLLLAPLSVILSVPVPFACQRQRTTHEDLAPEGIPLKTRMAGSTLMEFRVAR
eukprot:7822861-Pyramimonas_sp.AAC.1